MPSRNKRYSSNADLSKSLQRLIGTSADTQQKYSLKVLKQRAQYSGRMRDFRATLERSLTELEDLKIIAEPRIEAAIQGHEQAVWTRLDR